MRVGRNNAFCIDAAAPFRTPKGSEGGWRIVNPADKVNSLRSPGGSTYLGLTWPEWLSARAAQPMKPNFLESQTNF